MLQPRKPKITLEDIRRQKCQDYGRHIGFQDFEGNLKSGIVINMEDYGALGIMLQYKNWQGNEKWTFIERYAFT
jgi:hypothetical protein